MRGSQTRANVDITVQNNATWLDAWQFDPPSDNDQDDPSDGDQDADDQNATWDFTGQSFRLDIKGNYEDSSPLLSLTSGAGQIVVQDVTNRILHMNVPEATLTGAMPPGCYVYDLIMYDTSSPAVRTALMGGKFTLTIGVTGG